MDWGAPAQQRRGIVLHRQARRELLQLLGRRPGSGRRLPAQEISDGQQMVGTSLLKCPVAGQHTGIHLQPRPQPGHRHRRCSPHLVQHEPQPRQRAQLDSQAQALRRPLARREATNSTSAGVNVKNLISSSCPMSGNPRN